MFTDVYPAVDTGPVHWEWAKATSTNLDDTIFRTWTGKPVLVARIFHITPRVAAADAGAGVARE